MSVASGRLWLMDTFTYIAAAGALLLGLVIGVLIGQRRKGAGSPADSLQLEKDLAAANATVLGLSSQVAEATRERNERDEREKAALAEQNRIIREMAPLIENVSKMETTVGQMERERLEQFSTIQEQLLDNRSQQSKLIDNTSALQNALSNNQNRGKWGELNLKRLLEQSGLVAGIHFTEQTVLENEDGKTIKPDFIVNYPDGKFVAIDVKFPYANFERAIKIPEVALNISSPKAISAQGSFPSMMRMNLSFFNPFRETGPKISSGILNFEKRMENFLPCIQLRRASTSMLLPVPGGPMRRGFSLQISEVKSRSTS